MGYAICTGHCVNCGAMFTFNPVKVPSVRVKGAREPVCASCIADANQKRQEMGLNPFEVDPNAYEPCDEHELR